MNEAPKLQLPAQKAHFYLSAPFFLSFPLCALDPHLLSVLVKRPRSRHFRFPVPSFLFLFFFSRLAFASLSLRLNVFVVL